MAKKTQAIPEGHHTVTPSLFVAGAAKAIDFYKKALGAEELMRFPAPDGSIMHAELKIGDSIIMLGDEMPDQGGGRGPKSIGGTPVSFFVYGEDVDAAWKRAVDAGAKELVPLADQFWGDRTGCLEDPFGHQWWLAQHLRDLTPDELRKNAESFFSQMQAAS
jgi:PhnB protein